LADSLAANAGLGSAKPSAIAIGKIRMALSCLYVCSTGEQIDVPLQGNDNFS
jgi:hypothetical protein